MGQTILQWAGTGWIYWRFPGRSIYQTALRRKARTAKNVAEMHALIIEIDNVAGAIERAGAYSSIPPTIATVVGIMTQHPYRIVCSGKWLTSVLCVWTAYKTFIRTSSRTYQESANAGIDRMWKHVVRSEYSGSVWNHAGFRFVTKHTIITLSLFGAKAHVKRLLTSCCQRNSKSTRF